MRKKLISILLMVTLLFTMSTTVVLAETLTVHNSEINQVYLVKAKGTVKWTSSNKKIATIDKKGNVKGIKAGTVTIKGTSKKYKGTCKMKVLSYYENYKAIPDFGAMFGVLRKSRAVDDMGVVVVKYKVKNNKTAKSYLVTYVKKLKKEGYVLTPSEDGDEVWVKDDRYYVYAEVNNSTIKVEYADINELDLL